LPHASDSTCATTLGMRPAVSDPVASPANSTLIVERRDAVVSSLVHLSNSRPSIVRSPSLVAWTGDVAFLPARRAHPVVSPRSVGNGGPRCIGSRSSQFLSSVCTSWETALACIQLHGSSPPGQEGR
jgi:hypothetical protein